ncbi:MAG: hypothetical protein LIP77_10090 [Planctomycetes bacterium]|nr:hypothetical protein [Planctomycetota bacterium]
MRNNPETDNREVPTAPFEKKPVLGAFLGLLFGPAGLLYTSVFAGLVSTVLVFMAYVYARPRYYGHNSVI